jgi:hypothetical protein
MESKKMPYAMTVDRGYGQHGFERPIPIERPVDQRLPVVDTKDKKTPPNPQLPLPSQTTVSVPSTVVNWNNVPDPTKKNTETGNTTGSNEYVNFNTIPFLLHTAPGADGQTDRGNAVNATTASATTVNTTTNSLSNSSSTSTSTLAPTSTKIPTRVTYIEPLNTSTKKTTSDRKFNGLKYEDIQINLRVITNLCEGEKVMIINDTHMQPENRYFSGFLMRGWSGDSIETTLQFIDHLIDETKKHCDSVVALINNRNSNSDVKQYNLSKLIELQTLLKSSINGLNKLATTYKANQLNVATIETQIATIRTFCDQDLKKVVGSSY